MVVAWKRFDLQENNKMGTMASVWRSSPNPSTNPAWLPLVFHCCSWLTCSPNLQQCSLQICSVAAVVSCGTVFCLAQAHLFGFDRSVVTLLRRASVTPPSRPSDLLLSVFSLYPLFASYCKYNISSYSSINVFSITVLIVVTTLLMW